MTVPHGNAKHDWIMLDAGMIPAVFDCRWLNCIPGFVCHQHGFMDIEFEYILLSNYIKFQGLLTEQHMIMSFEAADDPCYVSPC